MKPRFCIELLPEAVEFLESLDEKTMEKLFFNMRKAQFVNEAELFKKLTIHIWEFRCYYKTIQYRLFAFWEMTIEEKTQVVVTHGIIKKSSKTPTKEIKKAEQIRKIYFYGK